MVTEDKGEGYSEDQLDNEALHYSVNFQKLPVISEDIGQFPSILLGPNQLPPIPSLPLFCPIVMADSEISAGVLYQKCSEVSVYHGCHYITY